MLLVITCVITVSLPITGTFFTSQSLTNKFLTPSLDGSLSFFTITHKKLPGELQPLLLIHLV